MATLFDHLDDAPKTFTVSEVTQKIKKLLEGTLSEITVTGEVSRPVYHSSGHLYFSLKDAKSQLSAACFRNVAGRLKFRLEQGQEVVATGNISVYAPRGDYQLIVERIEPKGVGALQIAFEQLKEKLLNEGLFDDSTKKPLPFLPQRIGIITSPTGAAVRDMIKVIGRRFPDANLIIYGVRVQGKGAAAEIASAITEFNVNKDLSDVEVLIIGRGGGSIEDLWAFNEEVVARAIFASRIPIISAVGHEIDFTISDFVSDVRAATPSAAGELVLPKRTELEEALKNYSRRLGLALQNRLERNKMEVLKISRQRVFSDPLQRIHEWGQRADETARMMAKTIDSTLALTKEKISASAGRLESLSPLGVLSRGYSVTTGPDGTALRSTATIKTGMLISTRFGTGAATSRVESVENDG